MKTVIGYAVRWMDGNWWTAPGIALPLPWTPTLKDAGTFPTKDKAREAFEAPGLFPGRIEKGLAKIVRIVQKRIPGEGRFVIRWRMDSGEFDNDYMTDDWWGPRCDMKVFPTWDAALESLAPDLLDGELPGPAIIKLKEKPPQVQYKVQKRYVVVFPDHVTADTHRKVWDTLDLYQVSASSDGWRIRVKNPKLHTDYMTALNDARLAPGGPDVWEVVRHYAPDALKA